MPGSAMDRRRPCRSPGASTNRTASPTASGRRTLDPDGWRFEHDPRLSFIGVDFARAVATTDAFRAMHVELSTDPTSPFVRQVTAQRRVDGGVEILRGCVCSVIRPDGIESRDLATGTTGGRS